MMSPTRSLTGLPKHIYSAGDRTHETDEEDVFIPKVSYSMRKHFKLFKKFGSMKNNTKTVIMSGFHGLIATNESYESGDFKD